MSRRDLEEIIRYETENTGLDFKSVQYKKETHEALLKDILSMANARLDTDRHIIVGVDYQSNGERSIVGIGEEFVDDAIYQQLVIDNIEPEISFKYFPFEIDGKKVGVFQIMFCGNPPYMMRKDFKKLRKGDCYIRKGSSQNRALRYDFDLFYSEKLEADSFTGSLSIKFHNAKSKTFTVTALSKIELPSDKAAEKIKLIIKEKEELSRLDKGMGLSFPSVNFSIFGGTPYENRDIDTLKGNLKNVKETYIKDDLYYLFETKSEKINIELLNTGEEYIEDASIQVTVNKYEGFLIGKKVYTEPIQSSPIAAALHDSPIIASFDATHYPIVTETDTSYSITDRIGAIKHNIPQEAFEVPVRFVFTPRSVGTEITLSIKVFGKNLKEPILDELLIKVTE